MKYTIVIERAGTGYSAYCPDLPGCIATGRTVEELKRTMAEAITFHREGLREQHRRVPRPRTVAAEVAVLAPA
jgi:predicted RNase H-like HicB family nuclease